MIQSFIDNPILLLFVVIAIGYWLGTIKLRGTNLGVSAVLFVGLIFGGISSDFQIPEIVIFLGLAIFVYAIGLSSAPSFFSTLKQRGTNDIIFIILMVAFSAALTIGFYFIYDFSNDITSSIFAGSTMNTPALAGVLDAITNLGLSQEKATEMYNNAVVGYSLTYPMAMVGVMLGIALMTRIFKIDFKKEEQSLKKEYPIKQEITTETIRIKNEDILGIPIRDLKKKYQWKVVFGRMKRGDQIELSTWDTTFENNDQIIVVGDKDILKEVILVLGEVSTDRIEVTQTEYVHKRIFVSNPDIAGEKLATLNLYEKFAAIIFRIRRGDMDLLATSNTRLELGDQVLFISRRKDTDKIAALFGDSFEALGRVNLLSFGLGMALGLLLGMVTITLPGNISVKLGMAGGPIIIALILGSLRRTGPIVWSLPHSANTTLRQIGLILLLAGIGINSGHTFFQTLADGAGFLILMCGFVISFLTAIVSLIIGYKFLKVPYSILLGLVATQPAVLDLTIDRAGNKLPTVGYMLALPITLIFKIIFAQLLFNVL
jgi:putative transport protein